MPSLYDQIKSQWGQYGEWDAAGVDRTAELAKLLESKGISDISQLGQTNVAGYRNAASGEFKPGTGEGLNTSINESGDYWTPTTFNQLTAGDKNYGFLGDVNNNNTVNNAGRYEGDYLKDNGLVGWSAQGHGNVGYYLKTDPKTGKFYIAPQWASSSDMDQVRDVGKAAAIAASIAYLGGGGLEGLMGGVSPGTVTPGAAAEGLGNVIVPNVANATNPALIDSALKTGGYGLSSAGAGNPLSIAQGGLGMTGAATSAYDSVLAATGSPTLANAAANIVGSAPVSSLLEATTGSTSGAGLFGGSGGGTGSGLLGSLLNGSGADWLKLLGPALAGYLSYKDASKPQLQGYKGGIKPTTATKSVEQGKYGPISRTTYGGMAQGGLAQIKPQYLNTTDDGMADGIAAHIDGKQPAALSGGEFVFPADVVSDLGNGNSNAGAKQLYAMLDRIRQSAHGTKKQSRQINPANLMPR